MLFCYLGSDHTPGDLTSYGLKTGFEMSKCDV